MVTAPATASPLAGAPAPKIGQQPNSKPAAKNPPKKKPKVSATASTDGRRTTVTVVSAAKKVRVRLRNRSKLVRTGAAKARTVTLRGTGKTVKVRALPGGQWSRVLVQRTAVGALQAQTVTGKKVVLTWAGPKGRYVVTREGGAKRRSVVAGKRFRDSAVKPGRTYTYEVFGKGTARRLATGITVHTPSHGEYWATAPNTVIADHSLVPRNAKASGALDAPGGLTVQVTKGSVFTVGGYAIIPITKQLPGGSFGQVVEVKSTSVRIVPVSMQTIVPKLKSSLSSPKVAMSLKRTTSVATDKPRAPWSSTLFECDGEGSISVDIAHFEMSNFNLEGSDAETDGINSFLRTQLNFDLDLALGKITGEIQESCTPSQDVMDMMTFYINFSAGPVPLLVELKPELSIALTATGTFTGASKTFRVSLISEVSIRRGLTMTVDTKDLTQQGLPSASVEVTLAATGGLTASFGPGGGQKDAGMMLGITATGTGTEELKVGPGSVFDRPTSDACLGGGAYLDVSGGAVGKVWFEAGFLDFDKKVDWTVAQSRWDLFTLGPWCAGDPPPPGPLAPVTDLRATDVTHNSVSLQWNLPSTYLVGKVIVRRAVGSVPPASPADGQDVAVPGNSPTTVTDDTVSSSTEYAYSVFAQDFGSGKISQPASLRVVTLEAWLARLNMLDVKPDKLAATPDLRNVYFQPRDSRYVHLIQKGVPGHDVGLFAPDWGTPAEYVQGASDGGDGTPISVSDDGRFVTFQTTAEYPARYYLQDNVDRSVTDVTPYWPSGATETRSVTLSGDGSRILGVSRDKDYNSIMWFADLDTDTGQVSNTTVISQDCPAGVAPCGIRWDASPSGTFSRDGARISRDGNQVAFMANRGWQYLPNPAPPLLPWPFDPASGCTNNEIVVTRNLQTGQGQELDPGHSWTTEPNGNCFNILVDESDRPPFMNVAGSWVTNPDFTTYALQILEGWSPQVRLGQVSQSGTSFALWIPDKQSPVMMDNWAQMSDDGSVLFTPPFRCGPGGCQQTDITPGMDAFGAALRDDGSAAIWIEGETGSEFTTSRLRAEQFA